MARRIPFACSFCGKPQTPLLRIIAGPNGVYICAECIALCNQILAEAPPPTPQPASVQETHPSSRAIWRRLLRDWMRWRLAPGHA